MEPYQRKLAERCNFTKDADSIESSPLQQAKVIDNNPRHPSIHKLDAAQWPTLWSTFKGGKNVVTHIEASDGKVEDDEFVLIDEDDGFGDVDYVLVSKDTTAINSAADEKMSPSQNGGEVCSWCDVVASTREWALPVSPTPPMLAQHKIRVAQMAKNERRKKHNNGMNCEQMDENDDCDHSP